MDKKLSLRGGNGERGKKIVGEERGGSASCLGTKWGARE